MILPALKITTSSTQQFEPGDHRTVPIYNHNSSNLETTTGQFQSTITTVRSTNYNQTTKFSTKLDRTTKRSKSQIKDPKILSQQMRLSSFQTAVPKSPCRRRSRWRPSSTTLSLPSGRFRGKVPFVLQFPDFSHQI